MASNLQEEEENTNMVFLEYGTDSEYEFMIDADLDEYESTEEEDGDEQEEEDIEDNKEKEKADEQFGEKEKESILPNCPVCMEMWTSEGPHRVCCIPCGHVYGRSCLEKWLNMCGNIVGKCPQCNKIFKPKHIINLYAPRIVVPNDDLQKEVIFLREEVNTLNLTRISPEVFDALKAEVEELKYAFKRDSKASLQFQELQLQRNKELRQQMQLLLSQMQYYFPFHQHLQHSQQERQKPFFGQSYCPRGDQRISAWPPLPMRNKPDN